MRFRNAFRLLIENFSNVYKVLLYKLLVILVAGALSAAIIVPNLVEIFGSTEWQTLFEDVKEFLKALVSANADRLQELNGEFTGANGAVANFLRFVKDMIPRLAFALLGVVLVYILKRFADTICYFAVGTVLDDRMSTYAKTPFSDALIRDLGRACVYSIVYILIVFVVDVAMLALCYFLFFYLLSFLNFFVSVFLSVTFIVGCEALKLSFTSFWMPAVVTDKMPMKQAMKQYGRMTKDQKRKMFSTYLVAMYLVLIVNVLCAIATVGSALLLTVPGSYFFLIAMQFVNYYTFTGRKYFLSYERIAHNPGPDERELYSVAVEEGKATNCFQCAKLREKEDEQREETAPASEEDREQQ